MHNHNSKRRSFFEKFFDVCIYKSWWVILFLLVIFVFYDRLLKEKQDEISKIKEQFMQIDKKNQQLSIIKEELLMQLNSQSDPEWIELVLMEKLGVVPQGYYKIHFKKS